MISSKISKTAMIMAAGLGMRLRPLTEHTPKPLVEVAPGFTFLDYHLQTLKKCGFEHIIVNTHYLAEQIVHYMAAHSPLPYTLSHEEDILGSGGGIAKVSAMFDGKPFVVVNSDAYTTAPLASVLSHMVDAFDPKTMDALLLHAPHTHTQGFATDPDFFMRHNLKIPCIPETQERIEFVGFQILKPEFFQGKSGAFSVFDIWHPLVLKNRLWGNVCDEGIWFETGHKAGLEMASAAFTKNIPQKYIEAW